MRRQGSVIAHNCQERAIHHDSVVDSAAIAISKQSILDAWK
jgi:hypothetical protein